MADESTNFGSKLQKGSGVGPYTYADVADVVSIKFPALETEAVETTNHGSSGFREYIGSGLKGLSEFTITVNFKSGTSLASDVGDVGHYKIVFPNSISWTFDAVCLSFSPGEADAKSPDVLQAEVTFQPTGTCAIA